MRASQKLLAVAALMFLSAPPAVVAEGDAAASAITDCELSYSLEGWSIFYKTAKGHGTITCDNGQTVAVKIKVTGGGVTFGKSEIVDGKGKFSEVGDISDLFGAYALAEAHAGAGKSSQATAMTKGSVSLALAGSGQGMDLGIAFGKFTIKRL
jgi:hypothetical protein